MRNQYEIKGSIAIVYATFKSEKVAFIFDLDTLEKMKEKDVTYSVNTSGYLYWVERYPEKKRKVFTVHRYLIFKNVPDGYVIDHINRDRNDNRKDNLRIIKASLNNSEGFTNGRTGKGYSKNGDLWEVRKSYNKKQVHFGYFHKEEDAKQFANLLSAIWK